MVTEDKIISLTAKKMREVGWEFIQSSKKWSHSDLTLGLEISLEEAASIERFYRAYITEKILSSSKSPEEIHYEEMEYRATLKYLCFKKNWFCWPVKAEYVLPTFVLDVSHELGFSKDGFYQKEYLGYDDVIRQLRLEDESKNSRDKRKVRTGTGKRFPRRRRIEFDGRDKTKNRDKKYTSDGRTIKTKVRKRRSFHENNKGSNKHTSIRQRIRC